MDSDSLYKFEKLLTYVHSHINSKYTFFDNNGNKTEAVYDTDYESCNDYDLGDEEYEDYHCIAFKDISNGILFEINYHSVPQKALCDGTEIY